MKLDELCTVLGQAKDRLPTDVIESQTMQFGYLNLGKRRAQRRLAPVFVAQIELRHKLERQAYVFAVAATEKSYLPLSLYGNDAVARARATVARDCHDVIR